MLIWESNREETIHFHYYIASKIALGSQHTTSLKHTTQLQEVRRKRERERERERGKKVD
jgi:hypothetical protein